eukprot:112429-Prorocentrum_minimum.AAC.1
MCHTPGPPRPSLGSPCPRLIPPSPFPTFGSHFGLPSLRQALLVKVDADFNVLREEEIDAGLVQCRDTLKVGRGLVRRDLVRGATAFARLRFRPEPYGGMLAAQSEP